MTKNYFFFYQKSNLDKCYLFFGRIPICMVWSNTFRTSWVIIGSHKRSFAWLNTRLYYFNLNFNLKRKILYQGDITHWLRKDVSVTVNSYTIFDSYILKIKKKMVQQFSREKKSNLFVRYERKNYDTIQNHHNSINIHVIYN